MITVILWVLWSVLIGLSCYALGFNRGQARERLAHDRLLRIDPPSRTAGAPANMDAEPSSSRAPQWRTGTFKSGPHEQ